MNRNLKMALAGILLCAALTALFAAVKVYNIPFEYMQTIANYDSDANLKTWDVVKAFAREGDLLVIMQPDGNYSMQTLEQNGVYAFQGATQASLASDFDKLTQEHGRVWIFLYNGLTAGGVLVPQAYREVIRDQYLPCFKLPLFFGEAIYLKHDQEADLAKAVFAQQLLGLISDMASEIDYRDLAVIFQKAKQFESAKEVLRQALTIFPDSPVLYRCLAECLAQAEDLKAAEEIFRCNVKANIFTRSKTGRAMTIALFQNAIYTSRLQDFKKARTLYFALLDIFGNQPDAKMESQVRRYFTKDVLLPSGDTNEAISQLLSDINLEAQDLAYSYNLLLDIFDAQGYSNAAVSVGYNYFKSAGHLDLKSTLRYGQMSLKYGSDQQLRAAIKDLNERHRYNPSILSGLRKEREWYSGWTNAAISRGLVPFGGNGE